MSNDATVLTQWLFYLIQTSPMGKETTFLGTDHGFPQEDT